MKTTRWMGRIGLLVMALMALTLQAAHVQVDFADFGRSSLTNRYITFSLQGMNLLNSQLISSESLRQRTDTNGVTTFSNCIAGLYKLDAASTPASFWWIHVPDTNGVISAASNAVANPVVYPGNVVAYTKAQVDALIAAVDTGGGGGSATNVFFISGQNTTAAQIGGSNTFHITGTLTNNTTGTAANATDAAFAAEATRAHGLLDLDSLDAVTTTLTKVVINSGHELVGNGGSLSNVPSKFFSSIDAMTNSTGVSNLVVYVDSYFGSNMWGGGKFKWENSSATHDGGTIFVGTSGRWRRIETGYPTNVLFVEWFGAVPNHNGVSALASVDSAAAFQAAINATPLTGGDCITPPFPSSIGSTLLFSNWHGNYFGSLNRTRAAGYRYWPMPLSVINWIGANGGTMLRVHDVGNTTFAKFGLDSRKGVNDGTQWSSAAGLFMDVDMKDGHTTTTTANVFDGIFFRERGTNTTLEGLRIAYTAGANCEFFQFSDCYFQGSGANIPEYWISTTNVGAAKAIRLGGGGGGANSFNHRMVNCGFNTWQYFIYSQGGSWDITANSGTAAGEAAYYIDGTDASYIRSTRDEGDRRFVINPSTKPVILIANPIALSTGLSVSNTSPVDGQSLMLYGNRFQGELGVPAITNSFNATGWYEGAMNFFNNTNDALIASWRFNSAFNSRGDFGTLNANNNIQSGPWKTPSSSQTTNLVYQSFTDSATFPTMTLMPSNGAVAIGGAINNSIFGVWNADPLNKTSLQIGDSLKNPRVRVLPAANTTTLEVSANQGAYMKVQSSNAVVNLVSGNGVNTLNFNRGYGLITGTNDTELVRFGNGGLDFKIKFPYDTNFEVVGTMQAKALHLTNLAQGASSALLGWSESTKAVTTQSVTVAGSQIILTGTDGKLLYNNAGGVDFADWDTVNNQGGTLTTNNNTLLGGGFVMTGNGARGVTNLSVGAGLVVENGVLKTNGETTGGGGGSQTPWTSDINAANYKLTNLNYASFSGGVVLDKDGARNNGYVGSVVTAIGGRSNLVQGSASSVDNVVLEGRSNVFNIQSSVAVGNAIIAGSSNLLNNPALATVRNSVILGGHGNNIQGASDALAAGSGSVVQSGHNGTFVLSDSQNTATLSQSSDTLLLRFQNGVGINTNNPGTNALFVVGSQTVTSNLNVSGTITGGGSIIANGASITNINSTNIVFHFTTLPTLTTNSLVVKNGETYIDADYNVAVTNIIIAGQRETLVVSNHSAATIAAFVTTASRKIGSVTSNGIQIAAGKFGYLSFDVNSGKWTNYAAAVEP